MASNFRLTQKSAIQAFLETDRLYAGYAIGDLEPGLFEQCDWYGVGAAGSTETGGFQSGEGRLRSGREQEPREDALRALALVFHGFKPPVLFLMGDADALGRILPRLSLPGRVYLNCREEHLEAAGIVYTWSTLTAMWRMVLDAKSSEPAPSGCILLGPSDAGKLVSLYASGGGEAFRPAQMEPGVYYGIVAGDRIVSVAGTHIVSATFGVAAIGNVFTHPDWRGRGFGGAVTRAVVGHLRRRGVRDIILNVSQSNHVAVGLYERVGFRRHCAFFEGPVCARCATRSAAPDHS